MSSLSPSMDPKTSAALSQAMHAHWRLFLVEGIILTLLGAAAILAPLLAGLAATIFLGWLFLIAGVVGLVATLRARQAPGFGWSLLSAIVALAAGAILLWNPLQSLVTLTFVLVAFFIVDGILLIILGLTHRRELTGRWEWMLVNGVIDLVLAAIVLSGLPGTLAWALGVIVGVDLVFGGATLIGMALDARNRAPG